MKIKFIPVFVFAVALSLVLSSYITGAANNLGDDCTGAEGTGGTQLTNGGVGYSGCNNNSGCHNATSGLNTTVELDSLGIAVTGYHPLGVYTVKISATNSGSATWPKFGFQLATVFAANGGSSSATQAGTWGTSLPANVQNTAGGNSGSGLNIPIIEQSTQITATTGTGGNGTTYVESIPWTAPAAGSGAVTIYGVINAVNNNNVQSGDGYQAAIPITIQEDTAHTNVGINEIPNQLNSFNVYPTLMNDNVTVAFDLKDAASVTVTLISMQGQTVKTFMAQESMDAGSIKKSFDVNGLGSGIYFVRLQMGNASVVSKVVKD